MEDKNRKNYDEEIKKLKKDVNNEYKNHKIIDKILDIDSVESSKETGFVKIGNRTLIKNEWFTKPNYINSMGFLSMDIPRAEAIFLISQLKKEKIEIKEINKKDINLLKEELFKFDSNSSLIIGLQLFYDYLLENREELNIIYDYKINRFTLLGFPVFKIPGDDLKNQVLIIEKDCGIWSYKINTKNPTEKNIHFNSENRGFSSLIEIYTLNKFNLENKKGVKFIKIKR